MGSFESNSVDNSTTTNALVELKEKFPLQINMDSQEIRDRYYGGGGASRDAFEELCAMYDAIQHEREENRGLVQAKIAHLRERNAHLRERNQRLREKYAMMVDAYNTLAEEAHDRSDSSSDSSSDDDDDCC